MSRRKFLQQVSLLTAAASLHKFNGFAMPGTYSPIDIARNTPKVILQDKRLQFTYDDERMVMDKGLQPSLLCTRKGNIIMQAQLPQKPLPQERMFYPYALKTMVSRDGGHQWKEFPLKEGDNGVNMEGGIIQLKDGSILVLDTYATPGDKPNSGAGQLYISNDEYQTLQGPIDITFNIPNVNFDASSDDGGRPHRAMRLHRRILELPNGDLLTTMYGHQHGDNSPCDYMPTMMKSRVMLFRSKNKGRHWDYVSTVAVDGTVGTEGFNESVIARISKGKHAGRLICFMRTGYALYEAKSDDEGKTWSQAQPRHFADIDVYKTGDWIGLFKDVKRHGKPVTENPKDLYGAVVDPDLLELRNGVLVAAFGVRITARSSWQVWTHPWNGNYLAFSLDGGDTWSQVVQMTSGIPTTHYMAIEQMPDKNEFFVLYDWGFWSHKPGRYVYGRKVRVH